MTQIDTLIEIPDRAPEMTSTSPRRIATVTGWLFILTFVTSIPAVLLYGPVLHQSHYILGAGGDARVYWGALLEIILIAAGIGTAVALFPVVKRQNESVALAYVTARVLESMIIVVGILSLLSIVTLRQALAGTAGTDTGSLVVAGRSLVAVHDWTFLMGPGLLGSGLGNGLLLGYLMYRSGLVPRRMAIVGLAGGTLICASGIAVLFGVIDAGSTAQGIATIPEFIWEAFLGLYLVVKGFKPSPILSGHGS